jgi:hypothetical protein
MNSRLILRPDLNDCILEERALPAITNLGIILLTTSGLSLVTPFPGASNSASGSLGSGPSSGAAAPVSGVAIPTAFYITGQGGISSLKPGNITGNPGTAAGGPAAGGFSATIQIGSGSDSANGPASANAGISVVGLFTVADPTTRAIFTYIGGMNTGAATTASSMSASQSNQATMQPASAATGAVNQSATGSGAMNNNGSMGPNPQLGAPTLGPFNRTRGMTGPVPGSLVPVMPMLPGNN